MVTDRYVVVVKDIGLRNQPVQQFRTTEQFVILTSDGRELFRDCCFYLPRAREVCAELNRAFCGGAEHIAA